MVLKRVRVAVVAGLLMALASPLATTAPAHAAATDAPEAGQSVRAAVATPVLTVSAKEVDEGDRYTLTATIKSPKTATRVTLQKLHGPAYYGDEPSWQTVKAANVAGRVKVPFKVVATFENSERHRVQVAYKNVTKPVTSNPVTVKVWRWVPLKEYDPYYETGGAIFGTTTINGVPYVGWGAATYSHTGAWESRFTPGRHCKSFRAVLGLGDISADGSSGTIAFTADGQPIYNSPALTPGMSHPVTLDLSMPYRFGIKLFDTTPGGTTGRDDIEAWPVLGEPAFLCTGV